MDLNPNPSWWILVLLLSASALTHSRVADDPRRPRIPGGGSRPVQTPQHRQEPLGVRPRPVQVRCHVASMEVVVRADVFDARLPVDAGHLRLGPDPAGQGSPCGAFPSGDAEFTIQAPLTACGSKLSSTEEKIIYSTVLVYSPEPSDDGLFRLDPATIPVECHYNKRYAVDGVSLHPAWVPLVTTVTAEDQIDFSLQLMTDNWMFERGSSTYFLGEPVNFEASAIAGHHMPLRVYVDHCVATATPDADATLRYVFIDNGCLVDAYLTSSTSHFLPRAAEHKLRFQMDAFTFHQESSNQVYISCSLKAVPVALAVDSQNRACSLIENRWLPVDGGSEQVCRSCDVGGARPAESRRTSAVNVNAWTHSELPRHRPAALQRKQQTPQKPQQASARLTRDVDYRAKRRVQLGPLTVSMSPDSPTGVTTLEEQTA